MPLSNNHGNLGQSYLTVSKIVAPENTIAKADYFTDGVDDDEEIQRAIDEVYAAGGGIVYIREGTYTLNAIGKSTIAIWGALTVGYGIIIKDNVNLMGAGINKTILQITTLPSGGTATGTATILNETVGLANIGISDMTLIAPDYITGASYRSSGNIGLKGCNHITLRNLRMEQGGFDINGSVYSFNTTTKELTTDNNHITIENVIVDDYLGSCSLNNSKNIYLSHCQFLQNGDDALTFNTSAQDVKMEHCIFDQMDQVKTGSSSGLLALMQDGALTGDRHAIKNFDIIGCTFKNHTGLGSGAQNGITLSNCRDIKILACTILNNNGSGIANNGGTSTDNITIDNCIIRGSNYGVYFPSVAGISTKHLTITHNKISNSDIAGIAVDISGTDTVGDNIIIENNTLWDDQAVVTQTVGIGLSNNSGVGVITNAIIEGNTITDATTKINISKTSGSISASVRNNTGYITENSGTGTIANGATSTTITHGLSRTPTVDDIVIIGAENPTNDVGTIWVDTLGATTFKVNCKNDPGASGFDFGWKAIITRTAF